MRVGTVSVALLTAALVLTTTGHTSTPRDVKSHAITQVHTATYLANSTQAVCALTGEHGKYKENPYNYTVSKYGMISGDSGSSLVYNGKVWWLFGNTGASQHAPWDKVNQTDRWPDYVGPFNSAAAQGSDSMATSSLAARPPAPVAPYNDTVMPPSQQCPELTFITHNPKQSLPYVNPSVYPDPLFTNANYYLSLRRGELPESGVAVGSSMYVVFGTDNPANCMTTGQTIAGPCTSLPDHAVASTCGGTDKGSRTRSVMAVYQSNGKFKGLYDLSAPTPRYAPLCPTAADNDDARFVNVQMANGEDGFIYLWGTEGGANNNLSPVYLARIPIANMATGVGIEYWNGLKFVAGPSSDPQSAAVPIFSDTPNSCAAQLGVQYNKYLGVWLVLYHCNESPAPAGLPNGIYMRWSGHPWGPWSDPTTIFNPAPDSATKSGFCYFIYSNGPCPANSFNATLSSAKKPHVGDTYGPYFVANWVTGTEATTTEKATTTIYYTLDTFDPYGQLIMRSTLVGNASITPVCSKKPCS